MATRPTALQWEIDWVNNNADRYDSPLHVKAVIGNLTKRYAAGEVARLVANFNTTRNCRDMIELLEHFS